MVRSSSRAVALLLAVLLLAVAHSAAAQRPRLYKELNQRRQMKADRRAAAESDRRPLDRAAMIARGLRQVGLAPEQVRAIRQIRAKHDDRIRDIGRRFLEGRRQLEVMSASAESSDERVHALATEMSKLAGERATARTMIELEVMQTLTPAQRGKMRELRDAGRRRALEQAGSERRERRRANKLAMDDPSVESQDGSEVEPAPGPPPRGAEKPQGQIDDPTRASQPPGPQTQQGVRQQRTPVRDLVTDLALTPEQQQEMRRIRRSRGPEMRDLNWKVRDLQLEIDNALLADTIDESKVKLLATELGKADAARTLARVEVEAAIHDVLTPQQRAKLGEMRRRRAQP